MPDPPSLQAGRLSLTRSGLAALGFLGIAGFFLVTEHTAHLLGVLPYLLLLACPLLHLLHHRGHYDHRSGPAHGSHHVEGD